MKKFLFPKILVVFLTLFGFSWGTSAQTDAFNKGDMMINGGVGIGNYISYAHFSNKILPISGSFEYGVTDLFDGKGGIGVGGYLAYTSFGDTEGKNVNASDLIIGPRGIFHYQFVENLDTYAGLMVGYDVKSFPRSDYNLPGSEFYTSWFIGARYYITKNIAVFGELGYGVSPLQLGLCYKF